MTQTTNHTWSVDASVDGDACWYGWSCLWWFRIGVGEYKNGNAVSVVAVWIGYATVFSACLNEWNEY